MKRILLSLLVAGTLQAQAQNILDNKVTIKYTQNSNLKIHDGSKTFALDVQMNYTQRNADSLKAYETAKAAYLSQLEIAVDAFEQQKAKIDQQHLQNLVTWEQQVAAGNTAAQQPVKQPYPAFLPPTRPKKPFLIQEITPASIIAATRVEGLNQSATSTTKVTLVFEGFEKGMVKQEAKGTGTSTRYEWVIQYRHPVTLKIEIPGKGLIVNQRIPSTESFRSFRTKEFKSINEFNLWWSQNEELTWEDRQKQVVFENMESINSFMTSNYGYPVMVRRVELYSAKSKDFDYSDVQKAFSTMESGMLLLAYPEKFNECRNKLSDAVMQYLNILKESDPTNKKARIDNVVTSAIYINLAECYLWMNDFINAEVYANKAITLGINKYERDGKALLGLIREQSMRYSANQ
jgi:hypothetical protein